jgi:cytochrome c oxidase subunit 4
VGVIFWFMHLIYDKKLLTVLFLFGMTLAAGTATALMFLFSESHVDKELPFYQEGLIQKAQDEEGS